MRGKLWKAHLWRWSVIHSSTHASVLYYNWSFIIFIVVWPSQLERMVFWCSRHAHNSAIISMNMILKLKPWYVFNLNFWSSILSCLERLERSDRTSATINMKHLTPIYINSNNVYIYIIIYIYICRVYKYTYLSLYA